MKLPWYMISKDKGRAIKIRWIWLVWQRLKRWLS